MGFQATFVHIYDNLRMRRHCPPNTRFKIRALLVSAEARYLSVKEAPHNIESLRVFLSNLNVRSRDETRDLRLSKQAALTTAPGHPQLFDIESE